MLRELISWLPFIICCIFVFLVSGALIYLTNPESVNKEIEDIKMRITKPKRMREEFYHECKRRGIDNLESPENRQRAELIAQKYGCKYDNIEQLFLETKNNCEAKERKEHEEKLKKEMQAIVAAEQQKFNGIKRYASLTGRDKRIRMLTDLYIMNQNKAENLRKSEELLFKSSQKQELNWATYGGIASGIAGGAAGLSVALDVQAKNAEIRAENKRNMDSLTPFIIMNMDKEREYRDEADSLSRQISEAKIKLVADITAQDALSYLSFEIKSLTVSKTGAFSVEVEAKTTKEIKIFDGKSGVIDGTVCANLYQDDVLVGVAPLVLPVYGISSQATLDGIALCKAKMGVPTRVVFTAHNLWVMEM